jgi:predicted RNA-binding protein associated with RNAse of E/G family
VEEVLEEFEAYVDDLETRLRAGAMSGTDGERAQDTADELIGEYRAKLRAEEVPSRGRELLDRFKEEAARL